MNTKSLVAVLLATLSLSAVAGDDKWTTRSADKKHTYTVLHKTAISGNVDGKFQVQGIVEMRSVGSTRINKAQFAVTGCKSKVGGYMGEVDGNNDINDQDLWAWDGSTVRDEIAAMICAADGIKRAAKSM